MPRQERSLRRLGKLNNLGRLKKPGLKLALALLAVAAIGGLTALATLHYRALYDDAVEAKEQLLAAQESLQGKRLDASAADLEQAEARFRAAGEGFRDSRDALQSDPLVWALQRLPGIGRQLSVAEEVLEMGAEASGMGLKGVAVAEEYQTVKTETESSITEKTMTLLDRVEPHMAELEKQLTAIVSSREQINDDRLLPPLSAALREVDEHRDELQELVDTYHQSAVLFPDFLGFRGPRTYLVLAQNNAELLPTGGLISVYGTLTLNEGRIQEMHFADAIAFGEEWQRQGLGYVEPPAPLKDYLLKDWSWNLGLSNWSPHFPTAARQALFFYEKSGGPPVDGVIGINVNTLQELLDVTGAVSVEEYGVTVDSANALDVTEELTRSPLEPGDDRKAFVAFLAEEMLHRLMRLPSDSWTPLLDTVDDLRDRHDVLFYPLDPTLQAVANEMGLDGSVQQPSGDYLMLVEASVNSTKLNIVIDEQVSINATLDEMGNARTEVQLHYENDLSDWEKGRDPELVRKLMLQGLYGGYLRILAPANSRLLSAGVDGVEAGLSELSAEEGKTVFGRFFSLPRDSKRDLSFRYVTPAVVDFSGDAAEYRLFIQKQPGAVAFPLKMSFTLPAGAKAVSLSLDGRLLDKRHLEIETDLSQDREIVLRYETDD